VNDALSILPCAREGAIKNAITERRQNTADRDMTRQDDEERVSAIASEGSRSGMPETSAGCRTRTYRQAADIEEMAERRPK
jgi:hypothetical protein